MLYRAVILIYGVILIAGGVMGYAMAGSMASLLTGGISGLLMLGLGIVSKEKPGFGMRGAAGLSLLLLIFWIYRTIQLSGEGKSVMISGMNIALAAAVIAILGYGHMSAMRRRRAEGETSHPAS
ncbi:MAG: TMEM14 family protein [Fimbriimonadaceae bacterium]|nr:TMEM14 family protein [Fimbriimonadaceae bacterium]QYK54828.1 MAG: TMEM14 family protein [Fimbriimonadaceae bacterium]